MSAALRRALAERLMATAGRWPRSLFGALDENGARLSRAREQGFDTDDVFYHGTRSEFDAFEPARHAGWGPGVYLTRDARRASDIAEMENGVRGAEGANVIPVFVRRDKAIPTGFRDSDVRVENPADIRSIFAAFDPARLESADLLAGLGVAAPVGAITLREILAERMGA